MKSLKIYPINPFNPINPFSFLVMLIVLVASMTLMSCGSNWTISGNNVTVSVATTDTIVKKGTIIFTPDSLIDYE